MPGDRLVARQAELERVDAMLDRLPSVGLSTLSIVGPAGIGKTSVWREGVGRARERDFRVLDARASQAETRLSFAGLGDLLASVEPEVFEALPPVPRRSLEVALLRADVSSSRVGRREVGAGLLLLMRELGRAAPVLVAVDDAQWLDVSTEQVLAFALRRLEASPIGVFITVRKDDERRSTFELTVPAGRRQEAELAPLSAAALHEVIKARIGKALPRPLLVQITAASGGNPFYALEIAQELGRVGSAPSRRQLPVPGEVKTLVRRRLGRLPAGTRDALLVASCLSQPTTALVDDGALAPAEEAAIVRVDESGRIHFTHPLFASAVYDSAPRGSRRRAHLALAAQIDDGEERARHLALGSSGTDDSVAQALETAARQAADRGAPSSATELLELALRLTPAGRIDDDLRRRLALGNLLYVAGDLPAAIATLDSLLADAPAGPARSQALIDVGGMYTLIGEPRQAATPTNHRRAVALIDEALAEIAEPVLAARAHARRAWISLNDLPAVIEHSRAVLGLIDEGQDPGVYSFALQYLACGLLYSGQSAEHEMVERSLPGQRFADEWTISSLGPRWPIFFDDFATARSRHEELLAYADESGNEAERVGALAYLSQIALWTGHPAEAHVLATESLALAEQTEQEPMACVARYALGLTAVHIGRLDEARDLALRNHSWLGSPAHGAAFILATQTYAVLGSAALAEGAHDAADRWFTLANDASAVWPEPAPFRYHADHVEAVISLGALDRADTLIGNLERRARRIPRPWICAVAARCRGRLLAAQGDVDGALAVLEVALEHHARLEMPTENGRTLLALGQIQRRRKQRRAARELLQCALTIFERVEANSWADHARAELARIPVQRAPATLTPTEAEIARLAANGLTNKAIAEQAFLSPKTVEANIARIYRKLGINSRAQLARELTKREHTDSA